MRNMFAHGTHVVLNPPLFLIPFRLVTDIIAELFDERFDRQTPAHRQTVEQQ